MAWGNTHISWNGETWSFTRNPSKRGKSASTRFSVALAINLTQDSYEISKTTYRSIAEVTRSPSFLAYRTPISLILGHVLEKKKRRYIWRLSRALFVRFTRHPWRTTTVCRPVNPMDPSAIIPLPRVPRFLFPKAENIRSFALRVARKDLQFLSSRNSSRGGYFSSVIRDVPRQTILREEQEKQRAFFQANRNIFGGTKKFQLFF